MSLHKTEAFVLRTYSLAEADKICVFFSKDLGKLRGVAHGARKVKSRFGSALEPFTQVALTFYRKERRDLVSVSTCDIIRSHFKEGARDVSTATAFSYLSELLIEFLPENQAEERIYRLVVAALGAISEKKEIDLVLRYFEVWVLRLAGYLPDIDHCAACSSGLDRTSTTYLGVDGTPRCADCAGERGLPVPPPVRAAIRRILLSRPDTLEIDGWSRATNDRLGAMTYQIIRHALERDLKSHRLLGRLETETAES